MLFKMNYLMTKQVKSQVKVSISKLDGTQDYYIMLIEHSDSSVDTTHNIKLMNG